MTLGMRMRLARVRADLTLDELGDRVNITPSMLSRYERNGAVPSATKLADIALVLGTRPDLLLGFEEGDTRA
jgi:transcriptional regulator with XRE-family HTH domain